MTCIRLTIVFLCALLWSCTGAGVTPSENLTAVLSPDTTQTTSQETGRTKAASDDKDRKAQKDTSETKAQAKQTDQPSKPKVAVETAKAAQAPSADTASGIATPSLAQSTAALAPQPPKKVNPFSSFLKSRAREKRPRAKVGRGGQSQPRNRASTARKYASNRTIASRSDTRKRTKGAARGSTGALPGVKMKNVFAIDEEETSENDDLFDSESKAARVASLTNMARRGDHGLLLQRPDVKVGCFPPDLLKILRKVERKFGRKAIITSGYRSAAYNRKIRGAKKSLHVRCLAADIQVQGISKWTLAKYLRSLPGRGGVGTYCHTKSVHIDIGTKRDWNRRCRRRKRA